MAVESTSTKENRKNLVVICLDTFRADLVDGQLGDVQIPNIDRLARESVIFDEAYGECLPTIQARRTFFTGIRGFPWRYNLDWRGTWPGIPGWHKIPPDQTTISEILLNSGYMTGMVSDTYHMFKPTMNFTRGFVNYQFVRGQETDNWKPWNPRMIKDRIKEVVPKDVDPSKLPGNKKYRLIQYLLNTADFDEEEDYFTAKVFSTAADWVEMNTENQPFFLWVDGFDPHEPWDPPKKYSDIYHSWDGVRDIEYWAQHYRDLTPEEIKRIKALYFGEVTLVDHWVGHFLDKLEDLNLMDNTILMLVSDHGTQLMDHYKFGKGPMDMFPYNTRIVWMIRHPEGPKGKHIKEFVQPQDLLPTSLHLLDIPYEGLDGESVWPLVIGEKDKLRDYVITAWGEVFLKENNLMSGLVRGNVSVRDKEWNYVTGVYSDKGEISDVLYSIPEGEKKKENVVEEYPDIAKDRKEKIEALLHQKLPAKLPEYKTEALPPIAEYAMRRKEKLLEQILSELGYKI